MEPKKGSDLEYEVQFKRARKGELYGCYILHGMDRGNMQTFVRGLSNLLVPTDEQEFAISRHDMREVPVQEALMDAETPAFMVSRKVVIVDYAMFFTALDKKADAKSDTKSEADGAENEEGESDAESGKNGRNTWTRAEHDLKMLTEYLQKPAEFSTVLFLIPGQKLDERKKLVTMLRKMDDSLMKSKLVAFEPPTGERLKNWLSKMVGNRGFTFAAGADDHFIELNGNDQMMLRSEMDKISLHLEAGGVITHELIERLGIRTFEQNVFKMIEYVCQKKLAPAHELLHELYKYPKDNNPFLILNLVARQFRMMLIVKQLDRQQMTQTQIAGVVGASPYVVKLTSEMAKRWNSDKLMSIVSECADLDYAFKSGRIDQKLALELLVLRLAS